LNLCPRVRLVPQGHRDIVEAGHHFGVVRVELAADLYTARGFREPIPPPLGVGALHKPVNVILGVELFSMTPAPTCRTLCSHRLLYAVQACYSRVRMAL